MTPLRLLIVEDDPNDEALLLRELRRGGYATEHKRVCTAEDLRAVLPTERWEIVISDWSMPTLDGLQAFHIVRAAGYDMPFIIVSGTIGEETAVSALRAGVQDFMSKHKLIRLIPAIDRELKEAEIRRKRREAEVALAEQRREVERSERLLRLILDSVPDGVVVTDEQGRFVLWNQAADTIVRKSAADVRMPDWVQHFGVFLPDKTTPYPTDELALVQALRSGAPVDRQTQFLRHAGIPEGAWLSVNARPLRDTDGMIRGAVAVMRDVTPEKTTQEHLVTSDRLASMGMLAAGVGHEVNNPLAAVMANLELALMELDARPGLAAEIGNLREMLVDARDAADRVRQVARDLKVFSRQEERQTGPVDLRAVLESTLRMTKSELRHRARLVTELQDVPRVLGDASRLGQVFTNLIVNAAHAIEEGHADTNVIRICARPHEGDRVAVEVSDTGCGMSPETIGRLFTPFFTTKSADVGTGLGLAICHRIVTSLGGELQVESAVGRGSTFRVLLPQASGRSLPPPAPSAAASRPPRRGRVLVVDDEPLIAAAVRRTLSPQHEVVTAEGGIEALERLTSGEPFDVVLCDLLMPDMTGIALFAALEERAPAYVERIVFLTGGAFTPATRDFLDRVHNERLEKPFDMQRLRALVNERLR